MSKSIRESAFKEFNVSVMKLIEAVSEQDFDSQLAYMTQAIENLETAKLETLKIHGGISN